VDVTSIARIYLDQIGERRYALTVLDTRTPPLVLGRGTLPSGCSPVVEPPGRVAGVGSAFECARPLTFQDVITLSWPLAGVVVLSRWADGTDGSAFFRGNGRTVEVRLDELRAGAGSVGPLAGRYLRLGTEHILLGIDHLLFVLGLMLLVRGLGSLVKTVTAFTVAHSITLGAAVLGYVPVDRAPVEAAIALSIVLLAREIVVGRQGRVHLVHRRPWVVSFVFGLLHGLGFAGALGAIGLRAADIPGALLFFNLGVEVGQVAFIVAVLAVARVLRALPGVPAPRWEPVLGYALGALSMLWFFQRLPAVVGFG